MKIEKAGMCLNPIHLSGKRELFWDEFLMGESDGISVRLHRPERRNIALTCNQPWEGNTCGYCSIMKLGSKYRLYYRASDLQLPENQKSGGSLGKICCAESDDGITFSRPSLKLYEFDGSRDNNIVLMSDRDIDNFSVMYDENPACLPDERFKGLMGFSTAGKCSLQYYKSSDGYSFSHVGTLIEDGAFDSLNLSFWDCARGRYFLYFRDLHGYPEGGNRWTGIRDVRVCSSDDFRSWSAPVQICFGENTPDYQLYTSGVRPYFRAPHVLIGMPTRYCNRASDKRSFDYLPDRERREKIIAAWGRSGTAMTDAVIMTSRDGKNFRRCDESFLTPGIERSKNWYYGDCYPSWGEVETAGVHDDGPNELSFYMGDNYRTADVEFVRYSVRLDGYFSWHADYSGGFAVTPSLVLGADRLNLNFSTSALGYLRVLICDENGEPLPCFDSGRLFGDSVCRPVIFDKPLTEAAGIPVRLRFELSDAELYSLEN